MLRWTLVVWACLASCAMAEGPTAQEIIEQSKAAYAAMETYSAKGTATVLLEGENARPSGETTFEMLLKRPNQYRLTWSHTIPGGFMLPMRGAVWSDGTQPFVYMSVTKTYSPLPSNEMAIASATGISGGVAANVPSLFIDGLGSLSTPLDRLLEPILDREEAVGDEACFVISGSMMDMESTVWISKQSYMIIKLQRFFDTAKTDFAEHAFSDAEIAESLKTLGMEDTAENRAKVRAVMAQAKGELNRQPMKGSFVEIHTEISSPDLKPEDFQFAVPEGTQRKEDPFEGMRGIDGE